MCIRDSAYTPLLELKENPPPLGYSILKNANVMENAYIISREHMRAPVVKTTNSEKLYSDFVANTDDTWLTFVSDLIANAKYSLGLDELSRLIFVPDQDIESLQPVWPYDDGNSSILYPDISMDRDLYLSLIHISVMMLKVMNMVTSFILYTVVLLLHPRKHMLL